MKIENLTEKEKNILRKLVKYNCEQCGKNEEEVGRLQIHRIKRGNVGGEYILRNIKMVCKNCHQLYHWEEPGC